MPSIEIEFNLFQGKSESFSTFELVLKSNFDI